MLVKDICLCIEEFAPLSFQESWDNCGLLVGDPEAAVVKVLLTVDVVEPVVAAAPKELYFNLSAEPKKIFLKSLVNIKIFFITLPSINF